MIVLVLGGEESEPDFEPIANHFEDTTRYKISEVITLGRPGVEMAAWKWAFINKVRNHTFWLSWQQHGRGALRKSIARSLAEKPVGCVILVEGYGPTTDEREALRGFKTRLWIYDEKGEENA